jgi:microsomal dipeptidase-like Zn-dependent dipeptidase
MFHGYVRMLTGLFRLHVLLAAMLHPATAVASPPVQVDLHLDTPTQLLDRGLGLDAPTGLEAGLVQLDAGGTNIAVMVLWPPRKGDHVARSFALLERVEAEVSRLDRVELATTPDQALAVAQQGKLAILLSLEGAHGLGTGDWLRVLGELHGRGLSLLGLTWSFSNRFAGSSGDGGGGLTQEGHALVAEARSRGIVLDMSHASTATTMEICEGSPVPVIASHSDAHAIQAHGRNLTDNEIRCIAGTGGVIGLNFHASFVGAGANIAGVADHADHLAEVGGHEVVALGSDFDGFIRNPQGLPDAGALGALWAELEGRGWTDAQLAGVRGENFVRAWREVQAAATRP